MKFLVNHLNHENTVHTYTIHKDLWKFTFPVFHVQVCGHNFNAGELGPGTIVGSAAFNMLVIIGLCVSVIPDGQSRKIKHLRVFFITAFWSIFAYIWLYLILAVISPGIVEVGLPYSIAIIFICFSFHLKENNTTKFQFWLL